MVPHFSFQLQNIWEKDQSLGKDLFYFCVSVKIMSTNYSVSCDLYIREIDVETICVISCAYLWLKPYVGCYDHLAQLPSTL